MPIFWSIFTIFGAKIFFLQKIWQSHTTSYGFLAPCQNSEKMIKFQENAQTDELTDGRTDRPYFTGSFWLPLGVQLSKPISTRND